MQKVKWRHWTALINGRSIQTLLSWEVITTRSNRMKFRLLKVTLLSWMSFSQLLAIVESPLWKWFILFNYILVLCVFSVGNAKMILIIIGCASGVVGVAVLVLVIYSCRLILIVYRGKKWKKARPMQEGIPIYQQKEGAIGVDKLNCPGPMKVVTTQKEILIYQQKEGATGVETLDYFGLVPTLL